MPIEDRNLKPGDVVVGKYKKEPASAVLIAGEPDYAGADEWRRKDHWLIDEPPHLKGQSFTSLSAAATAIVGSNQNGWRFFTLVPRAGKTSDLRADEERYQAQQEDASLQGNDEPEPWHDTDPGDGSDGPDETPAPRKASPKPAPRPRTYNPIYRTPNQRGATSGLTRYYCDGCQASFESSEPADAVKADEFECPAGHKVGEMREAANRPTPVEAGE